MNLIGLVGTKHSGKTTVANFIAERNRPYKTIIRGFADPLKEEVAKACDVTVDFLEEHKENFRLILQGWGTDFKRKIIRDDYWIQQMIYFIAKKVPADVHTVVIPDVRYINEAKFVSEVGGVLIRIHRITGLTDTHSSETESEKIDCHYTINNNYSLEGLRESCKEVLCRINKNYEHIHTSRSNNTRQSSTSTSQSGLTGLSSNR